MENSKRNDFVFWKIFQKYAIVPIASGIFFHSLLYFFSAYIVNYFELHKINVVCSFDSFIPQISFFVIPYCFFYIYIVLGPFCIAYYNKKIFYRYFFSFEIGSIIGFLFFIIFPTYVERSSFDVINIFDQFLLFIHLHDVSGNAFPSFHCFVAWLIYVALRNCCISSKLKYCFFIISFLICISTVFTKQHGYIDVFGGFFLAEIIWKITKNSITTDFFNRFFSKVNKKIGLQ